MSFENRDPVSCAVKDKIEVRLNLGLTPARSRRTCARRLRSKGEGLNAIRLRFGQGEQISALCQIGRQRRQRDAALWRQVWTDHSQNRSS